MPPSLFTLDSHVDTLEKALDLGLDLLEDQSGHCCLDLPRMARGGLWSACFTAFLPQGPLTEEARLVALARAEAMYGLLDDLAERTPGHCGRARTPAEVLTLFREGRRALVACLENSYPLGSAMEDLDRLAVHGLAYVTLCHQGANWACGSNLEPERGLSPVGRDLVRSLNRLGILVDISHASERTVREALACSTAPVIASHSSCKALCAHRRNLPDELIRELAASGGVIQICAYGPFLREGAGDGEATVSDLADHICHALDLVGAEHVGIGSDFDGGGGLSDCPDAAGLPAISRELLRRGVPPTDLEKIWGQNFLRTWERGLEKAEG
nr:dipeptidase [uncultured Holophaga sp.]